MTDDDLRYHPWALPEDPEQRLPDLVRLEAGYERWRLALVELGMVLRHELVEREARAKTQLETREDHRELADLREALEQLESGVGPHDGVLPRMSFLVGKPGLVETGRTLERLRDDRVATAARVAARQSAAGSYRLKPGKRHLADGRVIQPGDVIELTTGQALAWADKFEKVAEVAATT